MTREELVHEPLLTRPFVLLTAAHFLQALGYASLILLPVWLDHLGASRWDVGVVMGAAAFGGLVVRPIVAWSLDVVGRRRTLLWGTAVSGLGMVAIAGVDQVGPLIVAIHAFIGVGEAALFTGYFTFAADLVPERRRAEGLALFGISGLVPLVVNPIVGALGIAAASLRWVFPVVGLLIFASAAFVVPLKEPEGTRKPDEVRVGAVFKALRHPALWPVWLATIVFAGLVAVYMSFATVVAADRGVSNAGAIWLTYAVGAVGVRLFGASLFDRVGVSRLMVPAMVSYVSAVGLAAVAASTGAFAVSGLLAGLGHGLCFPLITSQAVSRSPVALRGSTMSLFTALWDVAKLLLVPVAGALADSTSDTMMLVSTLTQTRGKTVKSAPMRSGAERDDAQRPPLVAAACFTA